MLIALTYKIHTFKAISALRAVTYLSILGLFYFWMKKDCVPFFARLFFLLLPAHYMMGPIHGAIHEKRADLDYDGFKRQFDQFYGVMNAINRMVSAESEEEPQTETES